ncbi:MAG TPA: hypothetical protein VGP72_07300 [Planctomycetota bacterium]|jgi:hypothetical protein
MRVLAKQSVEPKPWLILFLLVAGIAGSLPLRWEENAARARLKAKAPEYARNYAPMTGAHYGEARTAEATPGYRRTLAGLEDEYAEDNKRLDSVREEQQEGSRTSFPEWSIVREEEERNPGVYFAQQWMQACRRVDRKLEAAGVESLDHDLGFGFW